MKVYWSDTALKHLVAIFDYISRDSNLYAERVIDRLTRRSEQIAQFPRSGREVPEFDDDRVREVVEPPYRIVYRLSDDRIDILAVVHSAQSAPAAT